MEKDCNIFRELKFLFLHNGIQAMLYLPNTKGPWFLKKIKSQIKHYYLCSTVENHLSRFQVKKDADSHQYIKLINIYAHDRFCSTEQ